MDAQRKWVSSTETVTEILHTLISECTMVVTGSFVLKYEAHL